MKKIISILLLFSFLLFSACAEAGNPDASSNNTGNISSSGSVSEEGKGPSGQQIVIPTGAIGTEQSSVHSQPLASEAPTDPPVGEFDDGIELPEIPG